MQRLVAGTALRLAGVRSCAQRKPEAGRAALGLPPEQHRGVETTQAAGSGVLQVSALQVQLGDEDGFKGFGQ